MKCKIHKTELICPQCMGAAGGRAGGTARTPLKLKAANENLQKALAARADAEPGTWTQADCLRYFESHVNEEIRANDLILAAPAAKRESARRDTQQRLWDLCARGVIERVGRGVYKYREQGEGREQGTDGLSPNP